MITGHSSNERSMTVEPSTWKYFETRSLHDGLKLRYAVYSRCGNPQRYVLISPGRTEYIEKYEDLAEDLHLPSDCGFLIWDHRGQGGSDGARADIDSYETYAKDAASVAEVISDKPYALIGHSMGGLIALYSTLTGRLTPRALVLSSPLLLLPNTPLNRSVVQMISFIACMASFGAIHAGKSNPDRETFENNLLTHSPEGFAKIQNLQYRIPYPTFRWVNATFKACRLIHSREYIAKLNIPVKIIGGGNERIVDSGGFEKWRKEAARISTQPVQLEMIPEAYHELLNELPIYRDKAVGMTVSWMDEYFWHKS